MQSLPARKEKENKASSKWRLFLAQIANFCNEQTT
jgi:hypothetical protein